MTAVWHVYRHCTASGEVIYIGCSGNLEQRTKQHAKAAPWWSEVAAVECFAEFDEMDLARDFEAMSIAQAQPRFNIVHNRFKDTQWATDIAARRGDCWLMYRSVQRHALTLEPGHSVTLRLEVVA